MTTSSLSGGSPVCSGIAKWTQPQYCFSQIATLHYYTISALCTTDAYPYHFQWVILPLNTGIPALKHPERSEARNIRCIDFDINDMPVAKRSIILMLGQDTWSTSLGQAGTPNRFFALGTHRWYFLNWCSILGFTCVCTELQELVPWWLRFLLVCTGLSIGLLC